MDFVPLFWFPLMFTESLCQCPIKVSVYIPLAFILHIFPTETECHIDLISFDCSSSSLFMATLKNSRIDQSDSRSQKKHGNNQSDGVMVDERWSTVDCLHVISMASIDLRTHSDLTDQLRKTKGEEEMKGEKEKAVARWQDAGWKSYLAGFGDRQSSFWTAERFWRNRLQYQNKGRCHTFPLYPWQVQWFVFCDSCPCMPFS